MKVRQMKTTPGVNSFMLGGQTYAPNDDGIFLIPESHVVAAIRHGFYLIDDLEPVTTVSTYSARADDTAVKSPEFASNNHIELTDDNIALALKDAEKNADKDNNDVKPAKKSK